MNFKKALRIVKEARTANERPCLRGADLQYANLRDADLRDADLRRADLRDADLRDADLWFANLRFANLRDADLRCADLRGANLGDTCLAGSNRPNGQAEAFSDAEQGGWVKGWRTAISTHCGGTDYRAPGVYRAVPFSTASTACHPGRFLWPTRAQALDWGKENGCKEIVEVRARRRDIHKAGCKWRAKMIVSLGT